METILSHPLGRPLYAFLSECNELPLEKEILDCGAGGDRPPLSLFYEYGYRTFGIDISGEQVELAQKFCKENNMELSILKGDVREIPFKDDSISFVYSINTLCHLSKKDTAVAVKEIERVLKPNGLCCINFVSIHDCMFGIGQEVDKGEFIQEEDWYAGIVKEGHICSYYEDDEPDKYFDHFEIIRKEKRIIELPIYKKHPEGGGWQGADIWYIGKKGSRT
jgi:ubiquinone/menaquinone biosynthesis C-methylase UbiE